MTSQINRNYSFGKKLLGGVAVSVLMALGAGQSKAAPTGGIVTGGTAEISTNGLQTKIHQTSDRAVIDWQSFNLAANESAEFNVPSISGATLNRISRGVTTISGSISSNGAVYFTNPNGLVFDANSQVTTNGFFAATQTISNSSFMSGSVTRESLTNLGSNAIRLDGTIIATSITALGGTVSVSGSIESLRGEILISSTNQTTIGQTAVIRVDAEQNGKGGKVLIWSDNHTDYFGFISARGGTLSGDGGFVEVSGKQTLNYQGLVNTLAPHGQTGTLLLDPSDIRISATDPATAPLTTPEITTVPAATGGVSTVSDSNALSWIKPVTIQNQLALSNVVIDANAGSGSGSGLITVTSAIPAASSGSNSLTLNGAQIVIKANITMASGGNLILTATRASVWQDPTTVITANSISGSGVDGFTLNGLNKFTNIGMITNHGSAGISVKNNQALNILGGVTLDGGTGGVSILTRGFDLTLNGALTVKGSFLRLDLGGSNKILGSQTITATGMDGFVTTATSGNAATINLGTGNFIFVTDNRATTTATTINNSSSLPTAFTVAGSGLTITAASTNGQGVVYGGLVDIQGITSTSAVKDLRYIEGRGITVSGPVADPSSSFTGSLTLVSSGNVPSRFAEGGILFNAELTVSNLTLIQSGTANKGIYFIASTVKASGSMTMTQTGSVVLSGIQVYSSTVTAGGDMILTQSGRADADGSTLSYGIYTASATLRAGGAMILTQSGSAGQTGILIEDTILTTGGAMSLTQSGTILPKVLGDSTSGAGIYIYRSNTVDFNTTLTAGGAMILSQTGRATQQGIYISNSVNLTAVTDLSLLQSGRTGSGFDGIFLYTKQDRQDRIYPTNFSAGANSWLTFKTNGQTLSLNGADLLTVTSGRVRIDLGTGAMVSRDTSDQLITDPTKLLTLKAYGLDVYFTGSTTTRFRDLNTNIFIGNFAKIDVGSGSFTFVNDKRSVTTGVTLNNTILSSTATIGWGAAFGTLNSGTVSQNGLIVITSGGDTTINNLGVVYGGTVTIQGIGSTTPAGVNTLSYIEGAGILVSGTASSFSGALALVASGAGITNTVGGSSSNFSGIVINANLSVGTGSNHSLSLFQTGTVTNHGIYVNSATLTAGGAMTLTQSGSAEGYGIFAKTATLTAGGSMSLTQLSSMGALGIYAEQSTLTAGGAMSLTQSGNAVYHGINTLNSTMRAGGAMSLTQSGSAGWNDIFVQQSTLTADGAMNLTQSGSAGHNGISVPTINPDGGGSHESDQVG